MITQNGTAALSLSCLLLQSRAQPGHLWKASMKRAKTIHLPPATPRCLLNWAIVWKVKDGQSYLWPFWSVLLNSTAEKHTRTSPPQKDKLYETL